MKKKIAIVMTTYNRKDMAERCITSLLKSDCDYFDVYVIDNAGTDGAGKYLKNKFGRKIKVKKLPLNYGGCNGFKQGVLWALKKKYEYVTLCDDDIVVAPETISNMYQFAEEHPEVGVVGPLTYHMENKKILQEYGTYLGWGSVFNITVDNYSMTWDEKRCKPWIYVDYIPACLMMIRTKAYVKTGGISIDYGGYFEDIDLGYKVQLLGYKIAVCSNAPIWHGKVSATGFTRFTTNKDYFMNRSKLLFYMRYTPKKDVKKMCYQYLTKLVELLYSAKYKKDDNTFSITMEGFMDGFTGKLGAVWLDDVQLDKKSTIGLKDICKEGDRIYINKYIDCFFLLPVINNLSCELWVDDDVYDDFCEEMRAYNVSEANIEKIGKCSDKKDNKYDRRVRQCYFMGNEEYENGYTYIDKYQNIVTNEKEFKFFEKSSARKKKVLNTFGPVLVAKVLKIRSNWRRLGKYGFLSDKELKEKGLF